MNLPFYFLLCDDDLVSKLWVSLVVPPELVCILPVFWAKTKHI